jgi:hypothetical protein
MGRNHTWNLGKIESDEESMRIEEPAAEEEQYEDFIIQKFKAFINTSE